MTNIVTWLTTYAAHVDGHHRAQLLAAAAEIAALRARVFKLEAALSTPRPLPQCAVTGQTLAG